MASTNLFNGYAGTGAPVYPLPAGMGARTSACVGATDEEDGTESLPSVPPLSTSRKRAAGGDAHDDVPAFAAAVSSKRRAEADARHTLSPHVPSTTATATAGGHAAAPPWSHGAANRTSL
jgi:hypothetical protein